MRHSETDVSGAQVPLKSSCDSDPKDGLIVYFDGSCPICSAEITHYASFDNAAELSFVDVSTENADLGSGLAAKDAMQRFHVRRPDGTLLSGARAFVAIWQSLPGWQWAARLAKIPGILAVLEAAYCLFLPIRPILSKLADRFGIRAANTSSRLR